MTATVLDAPDAEELANFYRALLGWRIRELERDWVTIGPSDGGAGLSFQTEPRYERPSWPTAPGRQQMMSHLDIQVDNLDAACAHALATGALMADFQPQKNVRVFYDPAGHPFCLYVPD